MHDTPDVGHDPVQAIVPVPQAQVFVPGPVEVHVWPPVHPPLLVAHELTAVQVVPVPE
jgi:hypothetical protein